jgi:hypothetical protein
MHVICCRAVYPTNTMIQRYLYTVIALSDERRLGGFQHLIKLLLPSAAHLDFVVRRVASRQQFERLLYFAQEVETAT